MDKVVVLGAGTMGRGIAQVSALAGYPTVLTDISSEVLQSGVDGIQDFLAKGIARGKTTEAQRDQCMANLRWTTDLVEAATGAELVIEAVPEVMSLKKQIFSQLDELTPATAILATNTSSLSVDEIAEASGRADRVIGAHFFNPVPINKLLEIVRGEATSAETLSRLQEFGERIGKTSIVVKNSPGFASSRLGIVMALEAMRMVEQGVASAADIDTAMELGYRLPMGPLRLTDLVGLDVRLAIAESIHGATGSPVFEAPQLLRELVAAGRLGRKSGAGFYDYDA